MKKQLFIILATAMLLSQCAFAGGSKRIIYDGTDDKAIKELKDIGCILKHNLKGSSSFDCPAQASLGARVRESRIFHISDLAADTQTGADHVWAEGINGTGVKVAILDTGIDTDHAELSDSFLGGFDYVNNDTVPEDDNGHGTHVAGIITGNGVTANAKGVSPGAGIYMYKVCDAGGSCYEDDILAGMDAVMQTDAKVMSISLGGGSYTTANCDSDTLAAKANQVAASGVTVVIAAGNDGRGVSSPGCASGAIAVGAVDSANNVAYFSGRGPALDIVAPGVSIYSTYINGYATMSGTSMATPHVSGVVALLLQKNPTLTPAQIKNALYTTANAVNKCYKCTRWVGSSCTGQTVVTCTASIRGAGIINAYNAYQAVAPAMSCTDDSKCDDGIYCNGMEVCISGVCQKGKEINCSSLGNQCNTASCNESTDACKATPKIDGTLCSDGLFCTVNDSCRAGSCIKTSDKSCNDGQYCTTDSCSETSDACVYAFNASLCTQCWSAGNAYLYRDAAQAKKFCKCATGVYGYKSYNNNARSAKVYRYVDSSSTTNWTVASSTSAPVYQVKCSDGNTYKTNQNYFRPL
jgi:hypothetical protein